MKQQKGKKKNPQLFQMGKKDEYSNLCHQEHAADQKSWEHIVMISILSKPHPNLLCQNTHHRYSQILYQL
jgi:hypothetical protein